MSTTSNVKENIASGSSWTKWQYVVVVLGIALRFYEAGTPELWRDEAFSVRAASFSIERMMQVVRNDTAPFLHYVILHYWMQLFGSSELSVRIPSILPGVLSIVLFKKLAEQCFDDRRKRFLAIALYCTNPHILFYNQMARVYSIVLMLALALYLALIEIVHRRDGLTTYASIAVSTVVGLYSFNLFPLLSFSLLVFILVLGDNKQRVKTLAAYTIAGLLYLPLFISFTLQQIQLVRETHLPFLPIISLFFIFVPFLAWERPPTTITTLDVIVRLGAYIVAGFLLIVMTLSWMGRKIHLHTREVKILAYLFLMVMLEVYLYSCKSSIASPRYLLFLVPIFLLILVDLYSDNHNRLLLVVVAASLFLSVYDCKIGWQYRGDTRSMIEDMQEVDDETLVLCSDGVSYHTLKYYSKWPVYVYDPKRAFPYYEGVAIFQKSDYYDEPTFGKFKKVYVPNFRQHTALEKRLKSECFHLVSDKFYKGDYYLQKWERSKHCLRQPH